MAARLVIRSFASSSRSLAKVQVPVQTFSLAGKYSGAAYTAALTKSEATLKSVESDLAAIQKAVQADKNLQQVIENPTLTTAERQKGLATLLKGADKGGQEITRNLLEVLSENGRLHELQRVIDEFTNIMAAHRGEVNITVTSAQPLDSSTQSRLEKILKESAAAKTGKSCKVKNIVNPNVLGGLVVDFGDKTIDMSVQSRIQKLNNLLNESV